MKYFFRDQMKISDDCLSNVWLGSFLKIMNERASLRAEEAKIESILICKTVCHFLYFPRENL